jgi:hypothetical protein
LPIAFITSIHPILYHLRGALYRYAYAPLTGEITSMLPGFQQIESVENLREYVNTTICHQFQLQPGAFRLTERMLKRAGKPCGMYFCLHGPRATKFTAIWETDRNQVLFYGSSGDRVLTVQLHHSPRLESAAA